MKSANCIYVDRAGFARQVADWKEHVAGDCQGPILFHVYAERWCDDEVAIIRSVVREVLPQAVVVGSASFGNICDGACTREDIVVSIMVFENPSTKVEAVVCPLDEEHAQASLDSFVADVGRKPWVKAIEAYVMADVELVTLCCDAMAKLPDGVDFFGGKSRFDHSPVAPKFVITDDGECRASAAVFVLFGGDDLHVQTGLIRGWNPLGRKMRVTKSFGDILCELDGQPAHDLYYKYLHIGNDQNFFFNTLEFPFLFYKDDASVIRISHACLDDGSMVLGASIPENDYVRIAFGDSNEIMRSVLEGGREFEAFRPDSIVLYSCACRRTYWGDERSNRETEPFMSLAPTSGFYTAGELLRAGDEVTEHNSTLIVAAFREGPAEAKPAVSFGMAESDIAHDESTNSRLSTFVAAAIDELETANAELARLSITDGLTGLLNRRESERLIREALSRQESDGEGVRLIMMDLDDFKDVNDSFGHQEGDQVLQAFASIVRSCAADLDLAAHVGRWGGEEFVVLAEGVAADKVGTLAEDIRRGFADRTFEASGSHTVSIGVTAAAAGEGADTLISRADAAMYQAKAQGKNKVVVL